MAPSRKPPPSLPPLGPTTRARSVAIEHERRPKTRSHKKDHDPKSAMNTSPTESPTKSPFDSITKVGPPRGQKKQTQTKATTYRMSGSSTKSSHVTTALSSMADRYVLFISTVIIFYFANVGARLCVALALAICFDFASTVWASLCLTSRRNGIPDYCLYIAISNFKLFRKTRSNVHHLCRPPRSFRIDWQISCRHLGHEGR
jgi:hypothetical protein